ncbi:MAG TPA: glycine--tRNA ligase subunit beta [Nevskiales bacterium]|nr:glycine--tRNA ligase subunit beta [Nevskiales bacterium]
MKHDLLLEIGCEDLPARYVQPLATAFAQGVTQGLARRGVSHAPARSYATPRRLAVLLHEVAARQPEQAVERRGPALGAAYKDGQPTPAALGFAKSCGVAFEQLERLETDKGAWLVYRSVQPGRATLELLPEIVEESFAAMDALVPKRMRWGTGTETFVRPVQWICALYGGDVVPLARFGLQAGRVSYGHRFHAPEPIALANAAFYEDKLRHAKVWADFASRRAEIRRLVEAEATRLGGHARITEALLDEVTALVEWPVVISGRMEARFMALPPEVIIATIEHNQRYFPVFGADGRLLPYFITISNIESRDATQVIAGNERVVRPRLADALFFWDQDRKQPLDAHLAALRQLLFQKGLGSVADKSARIAAIADKIADEVGESTQNARRAAELCKADLVTRMVFEFPELQGIMGGYYAKDWCEDETIAAAIRDHYLPTQSGGPIPATRLGRVLALADKLDTLAGIFALGLKPTASKDPYALRRAAQGVLRILIEGELNLDLAALLELALQQQPVQKDRATVLEDLLHFHWERLRAYYLDAGVAVEVFEAVLATGVTRVLDFHLRLQALREFVAQPEVARLAAAHKRVRNILRQAREKSEPVAAEVQTSLAAPCEQALIQALQALRAHHADALHGQTRSSGRLAGWLTQPTTDRYLAALRALASLQAPIDRFFDEVLVMDEDRAVRANRLALLAELDRLFRSVADIACLPG